LTTIDNELIPNCSGNITKAIISFSNSHQYRELQSFYNRKSNLEILGIHRKEIIHSSFIAWLLDPAGSHGQGTYCLKKFFQLFVICLLESNQADPPGIPRVLLDELIVGSSVVESATVKTELVLGKKGRVDISILCNLLQSNGSRKRLLILIENKVNTNEHDSQTLRYEEWLENCCQEHDYSLLVYLTPIPTLKLRSYDEPDCACNDFRQINYQYLVDYMIEPILALIQPGPDHHFIMDYMRALTIPSDVIDGDKIRGDLVMAISSKERKLLSSFWEEHRSIIMAALYAISSDSNQDEDVRRSAENLINSVSKKDYDRYSVSYEGETVARNIRKTRIGIEVARLLIEKGISQMDFDRLKSDRSSGFNLMKAKEEITESEMQYNRYRIGSEETLNYEGKEYFVCGNWGENNIPKFRKFLSMNFPAVKLRKQNRR